MSMNTNDNAIPPEWAGRRFRVVLGGHPAFPGTYSWFPCDGNPHEIRLESAEGHGCFVSVNWAGERLAAGDWVLEPAVPANFDGLTISMPNYDVIGGPRVLYRPHRVVTHDVVEWQFGGCRFSENTAMEKLASGEWRVEPAVAGLPRPGERWIWGGYVHQFEGVKDDPADGPLLVWRRTWVAEPALRHHVSVGTWAEMVRDGDCRRVDEDLKAEPDLPKPGESWEWRGDDGIWMPTKIAGPLWEGDTDVCWRLNGDDCATPHDKWQAEFRAGRWRRVVIHEFDEHGMSMGRPRLTLCGVQIDVPTLADRLGYTNCPKCLAKLADLHRASASVDRGEGEPFDRLVEAVIGIPAPDFPKVGETILFRSPYGGSHAEEDFIVAGADMTGCTLKGNRGTERFMTPKEWEQERKMCLWKRKDAAPKGDSRGIRFTLTCDGCGDRVGGFGINDGMELQDFLRDFRPFAADPRRYVDDLKVSGVVDSAVPNLSDLSGVWVRNSDKSEWFISRNNRLRPGHYRRVAKDDGVGLGEIPLVSQDELLFGYTPATLSLVKPIPSPVRFCPRCGGKGHEGECVEDVGDDKPSGGADLVIRVEAPQPPRRSALSLILEGMGLWTAAGGGVYVAGRAMGWW